MLANAPVTLKVGMFLYVYFISEIRKSSFEKNNTFMKFTIRSSKFRLIQESKRQKEIAKQLTPDLMPLENIQVKYLNVLEICKTFSVTAIKHTARLIVLIVF